MKPKTVRIKTGSSSTIHFHVLAENQQCSYIFLIVFRLFLIYFDSSDLSPSCETYVA